MGKTREDKSNSGKSATKKIIGPCHMSFGDEHHYSSECRDGKKDSKQNNQSCGKPKSPCHMNF